METFCRITLQPPRFFENFIKSWKIRLVTYKNMQNVRAVSTMDHISLQSPFLIELWELLTPPPHTHTHTFQDDVLAIHYAIN